MLLMIVILGSLAFLTVIFLALGLATGPPKYAGKHRSRTVK